MNKVLNSIINNKFVSLVIYVIYTVFTMSIVMGYFYIGHIIIPSILFLLHIAITLKIIKSTRIISPPVDVINNKVSITWHLIVFLPTALLLIIMLQLLITVLDNPDGFDTFTLLFLELEPSRVGPFIHRLIVGAMIVSFSILYYNFHKTRTIKKILPILCHVIGNIIVLLVYISFLSQLDDTMKAINYTLVLMYSYLFIALVSLTANLILNHKKKPL